MDAIVWENVIIGGWSQGSGTANLVALEREVADWFLLEGPSDMCFEDPSSARPATYISALVDGVWEPSGGAPRFGVWHDRSGAAPGASDSRPTLWDNNFPDHVGPLSGLRMDKCEDQEWDAVTMISETAIGTGVPELRVRSVPAQTGVEGFVSMAIHTNQALPPNAPPIVCGAHNSVAVNVCMPTTATSGLAAADAGGTNLFEAYVRAFCDLDQP